MGRSLNVRRRGAGAGNEQLPPPPIAPSSVESPAGDTHGAHPSPLGSLDAVGRIEALSRAFVSHTEPEADEKAVTSSPAPSVAGWIRGQQRRIAKTLVGLVVIAIAGWMPVRALLQTTSTEAIINARLITLRAPIEGQVGQVNPAAVGTRVAPGTEMIAIANDRAERGRLDSLRSTAAEIEIEKATLTQRRAGLQVLLDDFARQAEAFRTARMAQLNARIAETTSDVAAAKAKRDEAEQALSRALILAEAGTGSKVGYEKALRDSTVASEALAALTHRRNGLEVELSALHDGVFVGDSYNDRPQTLQRADELRLKLLELTGEIEHRQARLVNARREIADEAARYSERAAAKLVAPAKASIWEVMTSPGESVARGQDLMRLLDCSGVVVTATVGETAYNQLRLGAPARFRFRGDNVDYSGRIIGLTGVATAPANLAIEPAALAKEPYRVTVALPELARSADCPIGRTGRVTFDN